MATQIRIPIALGLALAVCGCGGPAALVSPTYDGDLLRAETLSRADIEVVDTIDRRHGAADEIGTARVGMGNREVPLLVEGGARALVDSVLALLWDPSGADAQVTPVVVEVDSLLGWEEAGFAKERAVVRCRLTFAYPRKDRSMVRVATRSERRSSSSLDVTGRFEGLLYEAITECASRFAENFDSDPVSKFVVRRGGGRDTEGIPEEIAEALQRRRTRQERIPDPMFRVAPELQRCWPLEFGVGMGFGSTYGVLGFKGYAGNEHIHLQAAVGTSPFVWRRTHRLGVSLTLLSRSARIRPRLTVLWGNNITEVTVEEFERVDGEKRFRDTLDYESLAGWAILGSLLWQPYRTSPAVLEIGAGWRNPSGGMSAVEQTAEQLDAEWRTSGRLYDVATSRWDHFTMTVGINVPLGFRCDE